MVVSPKRVFVCSIISVSMISLSLFVSSNAVSDEVVLRNNKIVKGVVVEEYADRVIISTFEGEKEILKIGIARVNFDLEEQNLTKLGNFYQDKRMFPKAYYFYKRALEVNPDYKKAKEGLNYVSAFMQQGLRMEKVKHIDRLNLETDWNKGKKEEAQPTDMEKIKSSLGLVLKFADGQYKITDVRYGSPAQKYGIRKGDVLVSTWGRNIAYADPDEIFSKLANPGVMDINLEISREVNIDLKKSGNDHAALSGVYFGFSEMEGLIVKKVKNEKLLSSKSILEGDKVLSISGKSTRYMSMKEIDRLFVAERGQEIDIKIKRTVVIWKKFGE